MTVAFDSAGNAYDVDTGNAVQLVYDGAGNAYDQISGQYVDTVISPDQTTVYTQAANPQGWANTVSQIASSVFQPRAAYPGYTSTYNPYYSPASLNRSPYIPATGSGVSVGAGSSGVGLNISPTTLLIVAVVGAAFLFGKRGR
jgi:hypothetical protein